MIPYGRQEITDEDIKAVVDVLRSDFLTQGPNVPYLEDTVAKMVNAKHAVAVNSGTSALHIACLALNLGPGDKLWTVPNTFVASANCARYCGAEVDFVDIDSRTWNMSVEHLSEKLEDAEKTDSLPKIVVPVHFAGQPTIQEKIKKLGDHYGFRIIEDACHSIGATRNNEHVGSCRWSDIAVFSFHPVKIVTTGEGGMATTNDAEIAYIMSQLRSHGITRDKDRLQRKIHEPWYYEQQFLGFNYRMTDIQAALGISQIKRLTDYVKSRNMIANKYCTDFDELPISTQMIEKENQSAYHLFVIRIQNNDDDTREKIRKKMNSFGISTNLHYYPVYLQPYYRDLGFREGLCPEAERYSREAITIPLYPRMEKNEQDLVLEAVRKSVMDN